MNQPLPSPRRDSAAVFRWSCFAIGVAALAGLMWMVNDLRRELKQSSHVVNQHLPVILEQTKTSTATLALLSEDLRALRDLAGASDEARDRSLVTYADSVLDFVETSGGQIGVEELIGKDLKDPAPAAEWVVNARKEALWLSFRTRTRGELLQRLCENKFGSPWRIQIGEAEPQPLQEWLEQNHPETAAALADSPAPPASDRASP